MVLGARTQYATRFVLFRVQIFRGSPLDHENHENITPRKIPAIRYIGRGVSVHCSYCCAVSGRGLGTRRGGSKREDTWRERLSNLVKVGILLRVGDF